MKKKIFITGINGFVGLHLAEYCLTKPDVRVYGTVFDGKFKKDKIQIFACDLTKKEQVKKVILKVKPDVIFHLAGQSQVSTSFDVPEKTLLNNIISDVNLFEVLKKIKSKAVVVTAGSSEEYGLTLKHELPIKEGNPLRPISPYAVSKITQEKLAFQYHQSYGIKTVLVRCFNTEGPRRPDTFVVSSFAKQVALIEKGKQKPVLYVGNLEAKRDFTDVRDVVRAYWLASQKCEFGEPYNICSGRTMSIQSVLDVLLSLSSVKNIKILQDPKRMRPSDISVIVGSNAKFKKQTAWQPKFSFKETMEEVLNYWRNVI